MDLLEVLKDLANMNPLEVLAMILNPIYGPMFWWIVFISIVSDFQKLFGKH